MTHEQPPCIACGAYFPEHSEACPLTPAPEAVTPGAIRLWYEAQTGLDSANAFAALWRILETLDHTGTTPADWRLVAAGDPGWAQRQNRTELERAARWVGESYSKGQPRRVLFLVPKE